MKKLYIYVFIVLVSMLSPNIAHAQFWKKIQDHIENKIEDEAEDRINSRTDKGIDNAYDAIEDGIDGKDSGKSQSQSNTTTSSSNQNNKSQQNRNYNYSQEVSSTFTNIEGNSLNSAYIIKTSKSTNGAVEISNKSNGIISKGRVYDYITSEGNTGKLEILNVDKNNNYAITIAYVTYSKDGSVLSQSNNFTVRGTYSFDLDNGTEEGTDGDDADFWLNRSDSYNTNLLCENNSSIAIHQENSAPNNVVTSSPTLKWSQFDFVPGDKVIFEDGPSADEENGEFPSKWDLYDGNAEIAEVDGTNVIVFPSGGSIIPYLKDSDKDYLPEVFTIEFDAYFQPAKYRRIFFSFYDDKNQSNVGDRIYFYPNSITIGKSSGDYKKELPKGGWRHFSIAVTKDKLKIYLNDTRLINIPHMGFNPTGITFEMDGYAADKVHQYLKNFRIAEGGVKYYDSVLSDGKIIVNGIRFDINKATIKPESMGAINKIYKLMIKKPELNFSVEGHTDADGDEASNLKLSKARGKAVMDLLVSMGISADRLKYNGFGESKPIDSNSTNEGKANNRRVEFVKF